jgi:hypothetical protein
LFRQNPRFAATDHCSEWGVRFFEKPRYGCLKPSARSTNNDEHLRRWLDLDVKSDSFRFRGLLNFQHIPMYQCIGISKIAHILIYIILLLINIVYFQSLQIKVNPAESLLEPGKTLQKSTQTARNLLQDSCGCRAARLHVLASAGELLGSRNGWLNKWGNVFGYLPI